MATRPDDVPGQTPTEIPVEPSDPTPAFDPASPEETPAPAPDFDQPDTAPQELPLPE